MSTTNDSKLGRRATLRVLAASGLAATGLLSLAGCGGEEGGGGSGGGGATGCNTPVDAQSQQLRTTLQYRAVSQEQGKNCSNCAQYTAGTFGDCGGCNVFTGPVQPNGHCLSWAAMAT
jgi:hypothetical protein